MKHIRFLETTGNNDISDITRVELETEGEVYYVDGADRWSCLDKVEHEGYFEIFDRTDDIHLLEFLEAFTEALSIQLEDDGERWGDTWRRRPIKGQEERAFARFQDYINDHRNGADFPWKKIACEALIGWVREGYPDVMLETEDDSQA